MYNIPLRIYLNLGLSKEEFEDVESFKNLTEVTWSENKVNEADIEYIRVEDLDKYTSDIADGKYLRHLMEESIDHKKYLYEKYAGLAMQGLLASGMVNNREDVIQRACSFARAMVKEMTD